MMIIRTGSEETSAWAKDPENGFVPGDEHVWSPAYDNSSKEEEFGVLDF